MRRLQITLTLCTSMCLAAAGAAAQTLVAAAKPAPKPAAATSVAAPTMRTPDGVPDIQGYWTNTTVTPLERPKDLGTKAFFTPEEAAAELASADALLVVMSFEKEHELFMRTSFTTKFLDYVAFGKPVILWGPDYCTPFRVAHNHGGALGVDVSDAEAIVSACRQIATDTPLHEKLSKQALQLHQTLFNPDRLQEIFVGEIERLVAGSKQ